MKYRTIIVGTDGSESALKAVEQAAEIAAALSARLIMVCAYHPLTAKEQSILAATVGPTSMYQVAGTDAAEAALAAAERRAGGALRLSGGAGGRRRRLRRGRAAGQG